MGGAGQGAYAGQPLANNVQSAYTSALGGVTEAAGAGVDIMGTGGGYGTQAGDIYGQMGGYTPTDVTSGSLATTDLQPYMDPFNRDVIDASMNDLNTQYGIQQQGINDEAARQNAFGGDRHGLQAGVMGDKFLDTKARTLADLNSRNFAQARSGAQFDISNKLGADTTNQGMNANMKAAGAGGLGNLASLYGNLGSGMNQFGLSGMGSLANMGFGFGNTMQQNQLAAGQMQQEQQQMLMDAIRGQYSGYTNAPNDALQAYLGALTGAQSGAGSKTTSQTNPGLLSYLGAGAGLAGGIGSIFGL